MNVYIVGEDDATKSIILKILEFCSSEFNVIGSIPARGGQIKSKIQEFNTLSSNTPVILLMDLDQNNCPPELKNKLIPKNKSEHFILNIAVDEAEAWLMADREGFASYFKVNINDMPESSNQKLNGPRATLEMTFPCKSSLYLTHELVKKMRNKTFQSQLTPKPNAVKGPEYNSCILPFIESHWNIENAMLNSDSLKRMVERIIALKTNIG